MPLVPTAQRARVRRGTMHRPNREGFVPTTPLPVDEAETVENQLQPDPGESASSAEGDGHNKILEDTSLSIQSQEMTRSFYQESQPPRKPLFIDLCPCPAVKANKARSDSIHGSLDDF